VDPHLARHLVELLSVQRTADLLDVSVQSVRRLLASGQLRAVHPVPGSVRVRADDLAEFIARRTQEASNGWPDTPP
jgi:excisionase family DNA binding protein